MVILTESSPRPAWMVRTRSVHFVALVAVFLAFTGIVASGLTLTVDDAVSRYFKSLQGNPSLDFVMVTITGSGDVTTLLVFGIIITIIRRTRKIGMVFLIALVALAVTIMYLKPLIGREIPPYGFNPAIDFPENMGIESDSLAPIAAGLSYPSGHAARATALAFIVGYAVYRKSKKWACLLWLFPVLIGITRVYVMQHYPTDIVGGFLFGMIVSVLLSDAMKLDQPFYMSRLKGREDEARQDGMR